MSIAPRRDVPDGRWIHGCRAGRELATVSRCPMPKDIEFQGYGENQILTLKLFQLYLKLVSQLNLTVVNGYKVNLEKPISHLQRIEVRYNGNYRDEITL